MRGNDTEKFCIPDEFFDRIFPGVFFRIYLVRIYFKEYFSRDIVIDSLEAGERNTGKRMEDGF